MLESYLAQNDRTVYNRVGFLVPKPATINGTIPTTLLVPHGMVMDTLVVDYRMQYPTLDVASSVSTLDVRLDDSDPHAPWKGTCGLRSGDEFHGPPATSVGS